MENLPALPTRKPDAHKGSMGRVLVIAGSPGLSGAAYLAAKAALRSGAGIVTLACPDSIHNALEQKTTCVMTKAISSKEGVLGPWSRAELDALRTNYHALAVGPGLGQHPATSHFLRSWLPQVSQEQSLVIDADALNAFASFPHSQKQLGEFALLTPHPGEFARWFGLSAQEIQGNRRHYLSLLAQTIPSTILLKGHRTLIARGKSLAKNSTGNPGMATAGSGDVLSGILATLLANDLDTYDSARLGSHLHGLAGDLAAQELGQDGLCATDLLAFLPKALKIFRELGNHATLRNEFPS